jgi:hypothetical protein
VVQALIDAVPPGPRVDRWRGRGRCGGDGRHGGQRLGWDRRGISVACGAGTHLRRHSADRLSLGPRRGGCPLGIRSGKEGQLSDHHERRDGPQLHQRHFYPHHPPFSGRRDSSPCKYDAGCGFAPRLALSQRVGCPPRCPEVEYQGVRDLPARPLRLTAVPHLDTGRRKRG